jgi:hypothetical protein
VQQHPQPPDRPRGAGPGAAPAIVRGLYVNRFKAQSRKSMQHLIAIADSTEVNALVLDMKDEFGLNFETTDPELVRNQGTSGHVRGLKALLDTIKAHGIVPVARLVVFKDSVAARVNPEHTIRRTDGSIWRDKKGLAWVNPYDKAIQEYNIRVAEAMAKLGFEEVQFDYIRFPEPFPSLPTQVFPGQNTPKPQAIADFLKRACDRVHVAGARCTADIFGLVTTVNGPLEVAQEWERLAPNADVLLPMVYPSHYPPGSFGIPRPNAEPYRVVFIAISKAHERNLKLGLQGERVRPYLQAFSLGKMLPHYGPAEVEAQKRAVYDAGFDGWVLWEPGSRYDAFLPALEKTLESRKKPFPANPQQAAQQAARQAEAASPGPATTPKAVADSVVETKKVESPRIPAAKP